MVIRQTGRHYEFRVYLPEAERVELVGSFGGWRACPIQLKREDTGWWSTTTELTPGDHEFSYLVNQSAWLPDYAANGVRRNKFGGWVSQLSVMPEVTVVGRVAAAA